MYYLFLDPTRNHYIQLTFNRKGIVATHTEWTSAPSTDFQLRNPRMMWSIRREWLSPNFCYALVAKSPTPITANSHPEIFI